MSFRMKALRAFCVSFLCSLFVVSGVGSGAIAQDAAWHVGKSSGEVWISNSGVQKVSITDQTILQPGDDIRTGQTGRILLVRGQESMLISPNSIVSIPKMNKDGMSTVITQQAGSILLEVEKRNVKHFEVETPYLAAVVKGTQFRVTVEKQGTSVDVLRGQVEVQDFKSGQYALIVPGQTAKVSTEGSPGLSLSGSGTLGSIQQGAPRSSSVSPVSVPEGGLAAPSDAPKAQQRQAASPQGEVNPVVASSDDHAAKKNLAISSLFTTDAAKSRAGSSWTGNDDLITAFSIPLGVGVFVSVAVAIKRRKQKIKNLPT
jgi:FecR protein